MAILLRIVTISIITIVCMSHLAGCKTPAEQAIVMLKTDSDLMSAMKQNHLHAECKRGNATACRMLNRG